ncbi:hypothetical protein [Azospirillum doebereinerae]|uniref:Uncharacterized protein n=1 Tax=Azospirillum doebereinerae TaxID=92933 RepID=A0A433J211_9PROT|nr:hypothetical protein [Azospirillum doebereinerae]RUQ65116.1 hypothetical protein EJ913_25555 [Azospirillum doebereinerae]
MSGRPASRPVFLPILAAFTIWAVGFLALYGLQATGCRLGWQDAELLPGVTHLRLALCLLLAGLAAAVVAVVLRLRRLPAGFARTVGLAVSLAAAASTLFSFSGVFWLSLC